MYKERVKGTGYAEPFEAYLDAFEHRFRYFDQLEVWSEFFPTVHVLIYEDLAAQGDLVDGFFRSLGLIVDVDMKQRHKRNVSLSNDLIAFKRVLNKSGLSEDALYETVLVMQEDGFEDGLELDSGSTLWGNPTRRSAYLERFDQQNAQIQQRFAPSERGSLFPAGNENLPSYSGLSRETSCRIEQRLERLRQRQS